MSHQLWYTSAERGLTPGSRGFCTVKATRGIPQPLAQRLESLSGYTHLFSPQANGNPDNPVAYHFIHLQLGGRTWYVLSRVCDAGLDYSGRTNKFAHHVVLDREELPPAGPAWLMSQPGFFDEAWDGTVGIVDGRKPIARHDRPPAPCEQWRQAAGDAGWAGVLAESAIRTATTPAHIIVPPHLSALPLLEEALALLPPEVRWSTTFSTFFTDQFPADVSLRWRVLIDGTREAARAAAIRHQPVINLTQRGPVPASILTPGVEAARQGISLSPAVTVAETPPHAEALSLSERALGIRRTVPAGPPPPVSTRAAVPRPPEVSLQDLSRFEPIRTSRDYARHPSAPNVLLAASLPLMLLLGIALGIAVQWRWAVLELSRGKDVAAAGDREQSSIEAKNNANTTSGTGKGSGEPPEQPPNAQQNATNSKPGGQGTDQGGS
ncbi:MAG: GAP1-N2 domain-containing protein, partial [Thermogutta sp.]